MIYARDKGRMCNNILQYAHVYAWGRAHDRRTLSMRFAYKYPYFRICRTRGHNFLRYAVVKMLAKAGLIPVVSFNTAQADTSAQERKMLASRNIVVEGWEVRFYDLFLRYLPEIKELFAFLPEVEEGSRREMPVAADKNLLTIGVHVRRGDYSRWHGGKYFYSDADYAAAALSASELFPDRRIRVVVCGNDPALDRDIYRRAFPDAELLFPQGNAGEDLCTLSRCDLLIGAPSTFSLVAAMYRDVPLWWIEDSSETASPEKFRRFAELFRNIR